MIRRGDWELALVAEIEAAKTRTWSWGSHDCVTFVLRCLSAMYEDRQHWSTYVGAWASEADAVLFLTRLGVDDLLSAVDKHATRIDAPFASRGDLVAIPTGVVTNTGSFALAICEGPHAWFAAPVGLGRFNMTKAEIAWRL